MSEPPMYVSDVWMIEAFKSEQVAAVPNEVELAA